MNVKQLSPSLGAECTNFNLASKIQSMKDTQIIQDLLLKHQVLFFPKQHLTVEQHVQLGKYFAQSMDGHLQGHPNLKLLTDVHETKQVEKLAGVIDCIQIPAFLCRQTDLIVECAKHFKQINVKKGQWLGPHNLIKSVDKIKETNPDCEAWVCQRGSNFGYHELIVHFGIVDELKQHYDRVILDCTHAIQRSRAVYGTQGDRKLAERYFTAADIFGYNGVFAEVHPNPSCAVSDADCQLELDRFETLLNMADNVSKSVEGLNND